MRVPRRWVPLSRDSSPHAHSSNENGSPLMIIWSQGMEAVQLAVQSDFGAPRHYVMQHIAGQSRSCVTVQGRGVPKTCHCSSSSTASSADRR